MRWFCYIKTFAEYDTSSVKNQRFLPASPQGEAFLFAFPAVAAEKDQNGEDLQAACQHIEDQHQLGKRAEKAEIAGRAYGLHTGTDVIEAGQHRRKVGADGLPVNGNDQKA